MYTRFEDDGTSESRTPPPPERKPPAVPKIATAEQVLDVLVAQTRSHGAALVLVTTGLKYLRPALIQGTLPLIGFVLFLFPWLLPIDRSAVTLFGFTGILAGFVTLIWRLRPGDGSRGWRTLRPGCMPRRSRPRQPSCSAAGSRPRPPAG